MKLLIRILITAVLVVVITHFFPSIAFVDGFKSSIIVAIVLALLNLFIKPALVLLTLPITFFTLGLFLLIINAIIILICAELVIGFKVDGFFGALLFSVILSLSQSLLYQLTGESK